MHITKRKRFFAQIFNLYAIQMMHYLETGS